MAGQFTTGETHDTINASQQSATQIENAGKIETDVPGIFADAMKDNAPVFDVDKEDFFNNMKVDRKRLRLKTQSAAEYHRGARYNRPFWLRFKDENGAGFLRKVK
jgi:hypothetical protein